MLFLVFILTVVGFGIGAIVAVTLSWVRNRRALPVWTSQANRNGTYGGEWRS